MLTKLNTANLGDYCKIDSGFAFKSAQFTQNYNDVCLVKGSNLGHRKINWEDSARWDSNEFDKLSRYELVFGDVVIAMDRPIVSGNLKFAWIQKTDPKALLVQRVARLRSFDGLDQNYLRFVIADPAFKAYIETITTGVNVPHISGPDMRRYKFPRPSLPTQQKIAQILSAYDDLIENNLKRIKRLEEMAQITYEEWFVRLKFPAHETTPINAETGLPEGWRKRTCFDVMDVLSGGTPKTTIEEFWNGNIQFFTPKDATMGLYTKETEKKITKLGLAKCNSKLYPKNTVFITARGTVGKLNLASEAMAMNQSCYALRAKDGLTQYFLYCSLSKTIDAFKGAANGGVFDTIVVNTFKFLPFIQPAQTLIDTFDLEVTPLFHSVQNLLKQNQHLKEARDILLPRLMTGIIDVASLKVPKPLDGQRGKLQ